ncbi:hypothetical protein AXF42_Ash016531 [Apostasia shenzhenica]|uniref:Uncharacterized protein n=1 Tax=Apostasia shenzhenica TaxID=1088818 RepID=A0A2I0AVE3_9ASPA|nr:hypothetical protein AXF42_Ash016531 [Apostasia shenzhenica]
MEVLVPVATSPDFIFDSGASATPYTTAPSTPRLSGELFNSNYGCSTRPTKAAAFHSPVSPGSAGSSLPSDFTFDSDRLHGLGDLPLPEISTAEELFDSGRIRPLQPPPPAAAGPGEVVRSARSRPPGTKTLPASSRSRTEENTTSTVAASDGRGIKKWRLKDLLIFSGTGSIQLTDSGGPAAFASEKHYTAKPAAPAEEKTKRTAVACHRKGLFGCIDFNQAIDCISAGSSL